MKVFYKNNSCVHLNFVSQIRDANEINRMNESVSRKKPDYNKAAEIYDEYEI